MGRTDPYISSFYKKNIDPTGDVALLGFSNNSWFDGDLYDLELNNWNINSEWKLTKKYDTIVSLRCPYFAKDPKDFVRRCYDNLNPGGRLYADWGLGDHWRFENFKVGWVKNGEHEWAYQPDNYLWSTVWDDCFIDNSQFKLFESRVEKFDYPSVKDAIYREVPSVLPLKEINKYFELSYNILTLWEDKPQIYFFIKGVKNG